MRSVLDQLYCGELHPAECLVQTAEYQSARAAFRKADEQFLSSLSPAQSALYETLWEASGVLDDVLTRQKFVLGFSLGVRIMLEVFQSEKYRL